MGIFRMYTGADGKSVIEESDVEAALNAAAAIGERGYQALVVVDAALRHQLDRRDAGELDRQISAQELIQAPAETDADLWVIGIADHLYRADRGS